MTDYEIVRACLDGDKECFSEIVARYKNLVYSVILRMISDYEEANDIAQEIFVKIYRNLDKYSPEYKFSTWVMRISANYVIDCLRKKKQDIEFLDDLNYKNACEKSPEEIYIEKESKENIKNIISALPDMYKIPIVLYHENGLSYKEIADAINEPLSKVKNRIFRGRKILRDLICGKEDKDIGMQKN